MTYRPRISKVWVGYPAWEDYLAGMYRSDTPSDAIAASQRLLTQETQLGDAMLRVTREWPNSAAHNLSDQSSNRFSWLGQAACCLHHGASDKATCAAWWRLSDSQRDQANGVADRIVAEWEWDRAGLLQLWGNNA